MARNVRKLRKQISTKKQKGAAKPAAAANKESASTQSQKEDEGWGSIGEVAKRAAKGAVKGAAKEITK